jgi:hypothetical protein
MEVDEMNFTNINDLSLAESWMGWDHWLTIFVED